MRYIALSLIMVTMFSCAAAVVGVAGVAGGYMFVNGQLRDTLDAPLPEVLVAAKSSFKELGFHTTKAVTDKLKGKLVAEMADGTRVHIRLKSEDLTKTNISIRVGYMGDKSLSIQILKKIKSEL